jgi:hypothetical protein
MLPSFCKGRPFGRFPSFDLSAKRYEEIVGDPHKSGWNETLNESDINGLLNNDDYLMIMAGSVSV